MIQRQSDVALRSSFFLNMPMNKSLEFESCVLVCITRICCQGCGASRLKTTGKTRVKAKHAHVLSTHRAMPWIVFRSWVYAVAIT